MSNYFKTILLMLILVVTSCNDNEQAKSDTQESNLGSAPLFTLLDSEETNISFINLINETPTINGFIYEYIYNGGGVAAGDLNNDGLTDLYFVSNMYSNKLYMNKGGLEFEETTLASKARGNGGFPTGVTMVDINADGLLDIYVCKSGNYADPELRRNELLINQGVNEDGTPVFEEQGAEYGLDLPHHSTHSAFFDYDKDGDLDMFLLNHGLQPSEVQANLNTLINESSEYSSEKLYNNENGVFKDVSAESGIINNSIGFGLGIAIGDMNNDQWPDIIIGHDYSESDHFYLNQKDGSFQEVIKESTNHISNFSMGNDIGDINNDGLLDFIAVDMVSDNNYDLKTSMSGMNPEFFNELVDLGLHHQYMINTLQVNNGNAIDEVIPAFSDIGEYAKISSTNWSWAPLFFDMDNDGWQDLFVTNGVVRAFRNNDFLIYKEQQLAKLRKQLDETDNKDSLVWEYYDNLLQEMPKKAEVNQLFVNNKDFTFSLMNENWGLDEASCSNGAIYSDLDNDGDLDIVTNNINDKAFIYRNNANDQENSNYLKINLKGPSGNSMGIGARVIVEADGLKQTKELYTSRGFQSSIDHSLHFGLGSSEDVKQITVIWPNGNAQILEQVEANQSITINHADAKNKWSIPEQPNSIFTTLENEASGVTFAHSENTFNDFDRESLLPHKLSQHGPALSAGDVNNDGLDDFYIGGARNQSASLYIQQDNGKFKPVLNSLWEQEKMYEDVSARFFDADLDGDLDLYVVSGGNEEKENDSYYQDRFYENKGDGNFSKTTSQIPDIRVSGSCVEPFDIDSDGDLDLFIGGKQVPGKYPFPANSYILRNESQNGNISFVDVTEDLAPFLNQFGMVSAAQAVDLDNDSDQDLIVVGEWTSLRVLENTESGFIDVTSSSGLSDQTGWWFSVAVADFDGDGDQDFLAGNLGQNYKYKASLESPFEVFTSDFDDNGSLDIVLGYHEDGVAYPLRGRECSSNQMPFIKKKFPSYHEFALADLPTVYGEENLENAVHYSANTFATTYIENLGNFQFKAHIIKGMTQFSSVNSIAIDDFNLDGNLDALLAGNLYESEVETPRSDAGYGVLLIGDGEGNFKCLPPNESGLFVKGEVRNIRALNTKNNNKKVLVFGKNNDEMQMVEYDIGRVN